MNIGKTALIYNKVLICILAGLTMLGLLTMQLTGLSVLLYPMVISVVFSFVCGWAYIQGWKAIARRAPESMPKYYLAGSAFRLMAAAIVLLVYCVVERHEIQTIKWFAIVFIVYYIVTLVFDAVFFAKVSKNSNK
jgi:hypothetical protein